MKPSTILLGHLLKSDLHDHPRYIDTALLLHHPLAQLTSRTGTGLIYAQVATGRGSGEHDPKEDRCIDLLKAEIRNGPGYGEFWTGYRPTLHAVALVNLPPERRTAIVDHGNPGA